MDRQPFARCCPAISVACGAAGGMTALSIPTGTLSRRCRLIDAPPSPREQQQRKAYRGRMVVRSGHGTRRRLKRR